ncbi:MAG: CHAT domain-containing protein [Pseudomonadota bacterium]
MATEENQLRSILQEATDLCDFEIHANVTVDTIFEVFRQPDYQDRIAIFHLAGHANGYSLMLQNAPAHAQGLAGFLGQQKGLKLVFLNGCSTYGHFEELLKQGIDVVIATSQAINDLAATEFSIQFYRSLAAGRPLETAFYEAESAVRTTRGEEVRAFKWAEQSEQEVQLPWNFICAKVQILVSAGTYLQKPTAKRMGSAL